MRTMTTLSLHTHTHINIHSNTSAHTHKCIEYNIKKCEYSCPSFCFSISKYQLDDEKNNISRKERSEYSAIKSQLAKDVKREKDL